MSSKIVTILLVVALSALGSCKDERACHEEMIGILNEFKKESYHARNQWYPQAKARYMDSLLALPHSTPSEKRFCKYLKSQILMELGEEEEAIALLEEVTRSGGEIEKMLKDLAIAYVRQGERTNCITHHASESCILPIKGMGVHKDPAGSRNAIAVYTKLLERNPDDPGMLWLLNLAYLTLGEYPEKVPPAYRLPGMLGDTRYQVVPFEDVAADLGLDVKNMAGGSIAEDFDNDGYLDLVTSGWGLEESMHFFKNNADGTFTDVSDKAGFTGLVGGLNIQQTDYNNDGFKDIFVLRGAWKMEHGKEPNSLLKNNGDGTFTDVTTKSGLLSFHPTQTATWNDFNNDGWLDVFIGNESMDSYNDWHPCELYINNQDGTFREVASRAKCLYSNFVKGVTSGDYDNDGWKDIFISALSGERKLLRNRGTKGNDIVFEDVTEKAGLDKEKSRTFPTWFWDYDNDGWLDIFVCDYTFNRPLSYYAGAEKLGQQAGSPDKMLLYHNNHDGTFTNVAKEVGLTTTVFAMGSNYGDIDNDGWLDMYLGTGNPSYESLIPNKMFKSLGGKKFADVTTSARVGHLQKGHGVSFADMDNDGDQDIYIDMGGAFPGDAYQNSFFMNPGQNDNRWISLQLEGTTANRAAIGTRVKLTFRENGVTRSVYRDVNSGGSFGSSPLRREIGIGQADLIDEIEVRWHGSTTVQVFRNVKPNQFLRITEGHDEPATVPLKTIQWLLPNRMCGPLAMR